MEKATLIEFSTALESDFSPFNNWISIKQLQDSNVVAVLDYLGHNRPKNETINQSWQSGFLSPYFVFNTSPYDLLKSRGFDIISDNKIRTEIQTYYDKSMPNLIDELSKNYELMSNFRNKYVSNLRKDPKGPLFIPSDVDAIRHDEIINGLSMVLFWNRRERQQFSELKELAEKLHAYIDKYLKIL